MAKKNILSSLEEKAKSEKKKIVAKVKKEKIKEELKKDLRSAKKAVSKKIDDVKKAVTAKKPKGNAVKKVVKKTPKKSK